MDLIHEETRDTSAEGRRSMSKRVRWWGLKVNGQLMHIVRNEEPMTVEDFENYDVTLHVGCKYKVVEVSVKTLRQVH